MKPMTNEEREALIAQGCKPPVAVDPDMAEVSAIIKIATENAGFVDHNLSCTYCERSSGDKVEVGIGLLALNRGRELAVAENPTMAPKPGLAWKKHDGSDKSPVAPDVTVAVFYVGGNDRFLNAGVAQDWGWSPVTHYAIITLPEGVA